MCCALAFRAVIKQIDGGPDDVQMRADSIFPSLPLNSCPPHGKGHSPRLARLLYPSSSHPTSGPPAHVLGLMADLGRAPVYYVPGSSVLLLERRAHGSSSVGLPLSFPVPVSACLIRVGRCWRLRNGVRRMHIMLKLSLNVLPEKRSVLNGWSPLSWSMEN